MNDIPVNNWAVGLAVFSFGFLSVGSVLFGATATTAILRGMGGALLFGALLWLTGTMISAEEILTDDTVHEEEEIPSPDSTPYRAKQTELQDK